MRPCENILKMDHPRSIETYHPFGPIMQTSFSLQAIYDFKTLCKRIIRTENHTVVSRCCLCLQELRHSDYLISSSP